MPRISNIYSLLLLLALICCPAGHCEDVTNLGGDLTNSLPGRAGLQAPAPNIASEQNRLLQVNGFDPFHSILGKQEGLGPRFVNDGCGSCHIQNGKGRVHLFRSARRKNQMIVKVSKRGEMAPDGGPVGIPGVGTQLQDRSKRKSFFRTRLRWRKRKGRFPDGTRYKLRKPRVTFKIPGVKKKSIAHSLRMTPGLIGLGLLDVIPEEDILALSDPNDSNADGISGVPNYVFDIRTGQQKLGRFGFKAGHSTLEQQTAAAAFFDMGVTSSLFQPTGDIELPDTTLEQLVVYQALAGVPQARDQDNPAVIRGKSTFVEIGCNSCHHMTFTTKSDEFEELDNQVIHPFSDLLLHDMGPRLADRHREYSASGSEWRTTPLWGIGFFASVSGVNQRYLHDGRARTIEEAILWHGGEASVVRERYEQLQKFERDELLVFLNSL